MRISWREILGLLVGLAICYGVISYALVSAPQYREKASEQTEARTQQSEAGQKTAPPAVTPLPAPPPPVETRTVTIRVTGYIGAPFSGQLGTLDSSYPVAGAVPKDYVFEVRADSLSARSFFATIRKTAGDSNVLTVQILDESEVVRAQSTTAAYGAVSLTWSPGER